MPVYCRDGKRVLFIHIPKTGGSTVERVLRTAGWDETLRETRKTHPETFPLRRCSPQHLHGVVLAELFDPARFDLVFLISREPVARFRSEYLMRQRGEPRLDAQAVERWAERALADHERDPYAFDNHLRPQVEFLVPGAVVYRFEDGFESILADLDARLDAALPRQAPRAMSSVKRTGVSSTQVQVSPALEATLRRIYADDVARFGY